MAQGLYNNLMSYHVLARKWRPQTFSDLVGQAHVIKALTFALAHNQVHHAYLFTGTRGVGKTSIARIFAKSLNCENNGVSANPCGQCENCIEIKAGKFIDLIEVDAASRTGVDETRELIDSVAYLPAKGRYKVYLIDEVHMFSKSSFNALLKTLEEPPEYVKFILATTDPDKLPITVLSRCLQFNLKSLTKNQIAEHLANICQAEEIEYEKEALTLLAKAGDGSMRDTLSIADQAIAYGQGQLNTFAVTEIIGTIKPADIESILFAIATNNPNQLSVSLHRLDDYEVDARAFLVEIMKHLQRMAWAKEGIVESLSPTLLSTVNDIPKPLLHLWYDIAEKALPSLALAGEPRQAVEMALLRMLAFTPSDWVPRHRTVLEAPSKTAVTELTSDENNHNDQSINYTETQQPAPYQNQDQDHSEKSATVKVNTEKTLDVEANPPKDMPKSELAVDVSGFAGQIQAKPIAKSDNLEAAEAQFGADIAVQLDSVESTTNTLPELESVPLSDTPEKQSWRLAEDDNNTDVPTMDEVNRVMQRGSQISVSNSQSTQDGGVADIPPWQEDKENRPSVDVSFQGEAIQTQQAQKPEMEKPDALILPEKTESPAVKQLENKTFTDHSVECFNWLEVVNQLGLSDYTLHFVSLGVLKVAHVDGFIDAVLNLLPVNEVMVNDKSLSEFQTALQLYFKEQVKVSVNLTILDEPTPIEVSQKVKEKQQETLLTQFKQEPTVKRIIDAFDAEVIEKTLKPLHLKDKEI